MARKIRMEYVEYAGTVYHGNATSWRGGTRAAGFTPTISHPILIMDTIQNSGLDPFTCDEAPTTDYEPKLIRATSDHPGQTLVFDYDSNRAYFFRVRTVLDEKGRVKSALYGKIYGDFNSFYYYLNPTPNDTNIEFDPNQNLLPNQRVTAP